MDVTIGEKKKINRIEDKFQKIEKLKRETSMKSNRELCVCVCALFEIAYCFTTNSLIIIGFAVIFIFILSFLCPRI